MTPRTIVLDANVLMRAVLGRRVAGLLQTFAAQVTFLAPEMAFDDVRECRFGNGLFEFVLGHGGIFAMRKAGILSKC